MVLSVIVDNLSLSLKLFDNFKGFVSDLGVLKSAISEMKVQYQTNVDESHRTFNSDLYDIYNSRNGFLFVATFNSHEDSVK